MTDSAIVLFSIIAILIILLLAALAVTIVLLARKRGGKKERVTLLNLPGLSPEEERILRKKTGCTGSVKKITTSSPATTAKIIKSWLTGNK